MTGSGVERSACVRVSKIADVKIMPSSSTPVRKLHWGCRKSAQSVGIEEDKRSEEHLPLTPAIPPTAVRVPMIAASF